MRLHVTYVKTIYVIRISACLRSPISENGGKKMKLKTICFKADEDTILLIEDTMNKLNLNQTDAIIHLMHSKNCNNITQNNNTISFYREQLKLYKSLYVELALDLRNALNRFEENGEKQVVLDVLEGFKCRI